MMQKRIPRFIALLLCLLMVIGMMPVSLADDPAPAAEPSPAAAEGYAPIQVKIPFNAAGTFTLTETANNTGVTPSETGTEYSFPVEEGENAIVLTFAEPEYHKYTLKRTDGPGRRGHRGDGSVCTGTGSGHLSYSESRAEPGQGPGDPQRRH